MELRHLQTFLQVASLQNFTQAAKVLGYSQSNVSAQIHQLEEDIGAPLFNRIGRRVTLTPAAEVLIPHAQEIVSAALKMEHSLRTHAFAEGTIRIGMVESVFQLLLEPVMLAYHKQFPRVKVELTVDATAALKEGVQKGVLDLACLIDDPLPADRWRSWQNWTVPIFVVAHPEHPLCQKDPLSLQDLEGQSLILMEDSAPYSLHFHHKAAASHVGLSPFLTLQSADMACRLASTEPFLSVLPAYSAAPYLADGRLRQLHLQDFSQTQQVQLVLHPHKVVLPQMLGFLETMEQIATPLLT